MQKIMILTLFFSPLAYGFKRPYNPAVFGAKKETIRVEKDGQVRVFPVLGVRNIPENIEPESVLLEAAESAAAIEGCDVSCFADILTFTEESVNEPGGSVDNAMEAMKYTSLTGEDAEVVMHTISHAVNIVGPGAALSRGALTYASMIAPHWKDPKAQAKIPEVAEIWAKESQRRGDTIIGTMQAFDVDPEEAKQREEDIKLECQAPAVG